MRREQVHPVRHGHRHPPNYRFLLPPPLRIPQGAEPYPRLNFAELYATKGVIGQRLADKARELAGARVTIGGYMAPPLDTGAGFFVLTRAPMPSCPFCDPLVSWPDDPVFSLQGSTAAFSDPDMAIEVTGILDVGRKADPYTGAIRLVRLLDVEWRLAALTDPR
jgi:hypothetical protein